MRTDGGHHRCRSLTESAKRRATRFVFPLSGVFALCWFLIRVIPKPQRAAYPCQRIAFPIASLFVLWLSGLFSSAYLFKKAATFFRQMRWGWALAVLSIAFAAASMTLVNLPLNDTFALTVTPNAPIGIAKGIFPGRVVWTRCPDATDWAGFDSSEHWYEQEHTDLAVVESMLLKTLLALTGEEDAGTAWDALFRYSNVQQGKGDAGYQPGENIVIKLNLVTSNRDQVDLATYDKMPAYLNRGDNSPQMVLSLLRHLVYTAGVPQTNIFVGDPTAVIPNHYWNMWHPEFPDVNYMDEMGYSGRSRVELSAVPFYWSTTAAGGKVQDYLPVPYAAAAYLINFAILKGHARSGITVCAKNHYGSLLRRPDGAFRDAQGPDQRGYLDYYNLHHSLPSETPGLGHYRALVDLMGHPQIGGITMLYLVDGLYGGTDWDCHALKWKSPGFGDGVNGDWPSSIFASQDPVAIDSVAFDFLLAEWPDIVGKGSLEGGAPDYLIEAALADAPPSGTFYDPDGDGVRMASLGVHEHWNNPYDKQYSRNLGTGDGIELIKLDEGRMRIAAGALSDTIVSLNLTNLVLNSSYNVMQSASLTNPDWHEIDAVVAGNVATNWTRDLGDEWDCVFYRIRQIPAVHNLLLNPSFEDIGTTVTAAWGWEDNNTGGMWGAAKREKWKSCSGDQAAVIVGDGTTFGGWWQRVPVQAGSNYQCSAFFFKETGWSASEVVLKVEWYDVGHQQIGIDSLALLDLPFDTWTNKSMNVTAPIGAAMAHFVLHVSGMGPGQTLYMDSAYLGK